MTCLYHVKGQCILKGSCVSQVTGERTTCKTAGRLDFDKLTEPLTKPNYQLENNFTRREGDTWPSY